MEQVNYAEILQTLQDAQEKLHYTDKQVASLTDTPTSTFSRYWSGKTRPPLEFLARAEKVLGINIKTLLNPAQADKIPDEQIAKETAQTIADKLNGKNDKIEELIAKVEELQALLLERDKTIQTLVDAQAQLIQMLSQK